MVCLDRGANDRPCVADIGSERLPEIAVLAGNLFGTRQCPAEIFDDRAPAFEVRGKLGFEPLRVEQVAHANTAAGDLVFVARTNATLGGSDRATGLLLTKLVDQLVVGQHDMGALAHQQATLRRDAPLIECLDFSEEDGRIDDRALSDDTLRPLVENPGRDQMEDQLLPADD